jgi:hypothetical protein
MNSPSVARKPVRIFSVSILLLFFSSTIARGAHQSSIAALPSADDFGTAQVGSTKTAAETLTNSGPGKVTVSQATITGSGFSFNGLNLPVDLAPGQSYTFTVQFAPKTSGSVTGNISVVYGRNNSTMSIALSGTGGNAGQLAVSPSTLSFGSVTVGSSKSMNGTLTATGSRVTVSSITTNNSEFSLSGLSLPLNLAAGQNVAFTVKFSAQSSGTASGNLSFNSNAAVSPTVEALSGSGTTTLQHSVSLSWSPVSLAAGYNVYRGTQSGGPFSKINTALDAGTNFIDSAVTAGQTYYYVISAVSTSGVESQYSKQVRAVVPSP